MKLFTPKVASTRVFVILCCAAFGSLILSYVTFGSTDDATVRENIISDSDKNELKNILMWTHDFTEPFVFLKQGRGYFVDAGCEFNNCYLTRNKSYLNNVTQWDALLFHGPEYTKTGNTWKHPVPEDRSAHQKYVYVSIESASNYPICDAKWERYFNWTMTYLLDSDVPWEYLDIRDRQTGELVGPRDSVRWKDMRNVTEEVKSFLRTKTRPVAWIVSNCKTSVKREDYAKELKREMALLGMTLDVYGKCGELTCSMGDNSSCVKKLKEEYRFYLSFENSFNADYVTEKLLRAMQNDVVPIVFGGANYARFAPPNSYINARKHSPPDLAKLIHSLMQDTDQYAEFFKWRRYYTYHSVYDSYETHPMCKLCKALNDPEKMSPRTTENIRTWWNGEEGSNVCK